MENTENFSDKNLAGYSDKKLLALCRRYGTQALLWRQKFTGLLPEVNRRRLYEKKGYNSIFEFGKRMAGLSEAQISLAINLEKRFVDKPALHEALVDGRISINKLARVASIATFENEKVLMKSAEKLSKSGLDVLVKDMKIEAKRRFFGKGNQGWVDTPEIFNLERKKNNQNGLFEPRIGSKSLPGQNAPEAGSGDMETATNANMNMNMNMNANNMQANINALLDLGLSGEVVQKLSELKEKGLDVNEMLVKLLKKREEELGERKAVQSEKVMESELKRKVSGGRPKRYIAAETKKILKEEYGTKCSVPNCRRDARCAHHTARFALTGSNNPYFLAPLCREHHEIAHMIDEKVLTKRRMQ